MLRRDTEFVRATVDQQIRMILGPEEDAPEEAVRDVQILVPSSPEVFCGTTPGEDLGLNRNYKQPAMTQGAQIQFKLRAGQALYASAKEKQAFITVIVQYLEE